MDALKDWISKCLLDGFSEEQVKTQMSFNGYDQKTIDKYFPKKHKSGKSFHVWVALISVFLILALIGGLLYFFANSIILVDRAEVDPGLRLEPPDPTASSLITFSKGVREINLESGQHHVVMKVYNPHSSSIDFRNIILDCESGFDEFVDLQIPHMTLNSGMVSEIPVLIVVGSETGASESICEVIIRDDVDSSLIIMRKFIFTVGLDKSSLTLNEPVIIDVDSSN